MESSPKTPKFPTSVTLILRMGFLKVPAGYTTGRMMQHAAHTNLLNTNALIFLARLHTTEAYGSVQGSVFVDRRAGGDSSAVQDQLQSV